MTNQKSVLDFPGLVGVARSNSKHTSQFLAQEKIAQGEDGQSVAEAEARAVMLKRFNSEQGSSDPLLTLEGDMTLEQIKERFFQIRERARAANAK